MSMSSEVACVCFADVVELGKHHTRALDGRAKAIAQKSIVIHGQAWEWKAVLHAPLEVDGPAAYAQQGLQGQHPLDQDCRLTLIRFHGYKFHVGLL